MYFPVKSAIARLGGITEAARILGMKKPAVAAWVAYTRRSKPEPEVLDRLADLSGITRESFDTYYRNLEVFKTNESFRRRKPK